MNNNGIEIIKTAIAELGQVESPMNSNMQKYAEWYDPSLNGQPWCAIWVSYIFDKSGFTLNNVETSKGYHYCPIALRYFKLTEQVIKYTKVSAGDIIFFDWDYNGKVDHTGIFLQDNGDRLSFFSIEGNTAIGNDSNGGEVMIRLRKYRQSVFVHPNVLDNEK